MENETVDALSVGQSISGDLTVWGLFWEADIVVKVVIVLLIFASFWTWAIIFDKVRTIRRLRNRAEEFEESFWSGGSLDDLYDRIDNRPRDPMAAIFVSAMREWRRSSGAVGAKAELLKEGVKDRIMRVMDITMGREMQRLEQHMVFLASVGSAAPFIGLFGTVWGIMNAFTSIAAAQNTTLAVVAPGIAEALFATALGLVAAIPAVIAFNKLSTDLGRYGAQLEAFSGEFGAILSRQIDEQA